MPTFMMALAHLSNSDLIATLPRRLVERHAARFRLVSVEPPLRRKPDPRFDAIESELRGVRAELKSIRAELDEQRDKVENVLGYRKEIDHALERIATIERHLDIHKNAAA